MKRTPFALLMAAALLAFTFTTAYAEDETPTITDSVEEFAEDMDDAMDDADDAIDAPRGSWRRGDRDGWRGRPGRDRFDGRFGRPGPGMGRGPARHHRDGMGMGMGMDHGMGMGFGFHPRMWEVIQLDAAQKTKLVDAMTAGFRARLEARMEMHEAARALRELYREEAPQAEAVIAAHSAMGAARGRMLVVADQLKKDIDAILTPEQKAKMEELRKAPPHRFGKKDGRPGRPGPGGPGPRR